MAFARFEDLGGHLEVLIFPKMYEALKDFIIPDKIVAVDGYINFKDGSAKLLAEQIQEISEQANLLDFEPRAKKTQGYSKNNYNGSNGNSGGFNSYNNAPLPPKKPGVKEYNFSPKNLTVTIPKGSDKTILAELKSVFLENKGNSSVTIKVPDNGHGYKEVAIKAKVSIDPVLNRKLYELIGKENVSAR